MKLLDSHLRRLFKAAAQAQRPVPSRVPFAVESRVLAQWRVASAEDDLLGYLPLLRGGLALACALVLLCVAFSLWELAQRSPDELAISNSAVVLNLMP